MRRRIAAIVVAAIAVLGPMSAAHAEAPQPPEQPRPVAVTVLWPLCVQVLGTWACIPP